MPNSTVLLVNSNIISFLRVHSRGPEPGGDLSHDFRPSSSSSPSRFLRRLLLLPRGLCPLRGLWLLLAGFFFFFFFLAGFAADPTPSPPPLRTGLLLGCHGLERFALLLLPKDVHVYSGPPKPDFKFLVRWVRFRPFCHFATVCSFCLTDTMKTTSSRQRPNATCFS